MSFQTLRVLVVPLLVVTLSVATPVPYRADRSQIQVVMQLVSVVNQLVVTLSVATVDLTARAAMLTLVLSVTAMVATPSTAMENSGRETEAMAMAMEMVVVTIQADLTALHLRLDHLPHLVRLPLPRLRLGPLVSIVFKSAFSARNNTSSIAPPPPFRNGGGNAYTGNTGDDRGGDVVNVTDEGADITNTATANTAGAGGTATSGDATGGDA